jgi:type IV secretion system protein TrbE
MARRTSAKSLAELLPWGVLAGSGLVLTKDGLWLAGYYFRPPDSASRTDDESDMLALHVNDALRSLGSGWATWSDVVSYPSSQYPAPEESSFPDWYSAAVDDARRESFRAAGQHFENDRAFLIAFKPPAKQVSKLTDLFLSDNKRGRTPTQRRVMQNFERDLGILENRMAGPLGMRRMQTFEVQDGTGGRHLQDELVNYLNFCATGRAQGIMLPSSAIDLDHVIAEQDLYPVNNPIIGGDYIAVVTIDGFPAESQANIISALNTLRMPYRFVQRMIYLDNVEAVKHIDKHRMKWKQKVTGFAAKVLQTAETPVNEHAAAMMAEAQTAMGWAESGDVKFGYYSPVVILRHRDLVTLHEWADDVAKIIQDCGFNARIEEVNTLEAWFGGHPGETEANVRRPPIHTQTLTDLMPISGIWTGEASAPCPLYPQPAPALLWAITDGGIPFRLNLHTSVNPDVGHAVVFGPSGAGKSTLTNLIALQARRYPGMRITAFDRKFAMMATVLACGGTHHDLAAVDCDDGMFCPLAVLETEPDRVWAKDYAVILYQLSANVAPGQKERGLISQAIDRLATGRPDRRSISEFCMALQSEEARHVFEFYTHDGTAGAYLDGRQDRVTDSDFNVFETQDLMDLGDATSLPVMLYQFRRFERSLTSGQPSLLFIAEAWQAFAHDIWRKRLAVWLRTLRSKNCAVVMDTQSLADAVQSNILPLLNESCPRKIFLPNPVARQSTGMVQQPGPYELCKMFGLNDNQIDIIRSAVPKREYYVTGPDGCRKVALGMSPLEMAVAGATSEPDANTVRAFVGQHGDGWLKPYLQSKGLIDA